MARGEAEGIDASAIREAIEKATGAMGDVLRVKQQLTGAKTSIDKGADILEALATAVRAQLQQVELLLAAAGEELDGAPPAEVPPAEEERLPRAATIAAGQRPRVVREPEPPFPGAQQLPF
jgi:hypothetical protein